MPARTRVQARCSQSIPDDFDIATVPGLRTEARQVLLRFCPTTLGQAARLAGINPADVAVLLVYLERHSSRGAPEPLVPA